MRSDQRPNLAALWPLYVGEFAVLLSLILGVGQAAGSQFPYPAFVLAALIASSFGFFLRRKSPVHES